MTTNQLYQKLIEAYSITNLNKISLTLINLYKNRQYSSLQIIAEIISETVDIEITGNGKGFSKFMMLYHPDRANVHLNEINKLFAEENYNGLLDYSHILMLSHIDEFAASLENYEDIDYSPVYEWDFTTEGFTIINDNCSNESSGKHSRKKHISFKTYNFYDAVKVRMFENTKIEYPYYYLEDIDEFELASSDINNLEGIEFCKQVKNLDLSDNHIYDLSPLSGLGLLEELNLSDNEIVDIDVLSNLENLRIINLSNNNINDIQPIMNLPKLEFADLRGTLADKKQVEELRKLGLSIEI